MNPGYDSFSRRSFSGTGPSPNGGFNDFGGYPEVSGPPNYPPPLTGPGRSSYSSMPNPNIPPPASLSQSYPSSGPGFSGGLGPSYPMSNRDQTSFPGGFDTPGMSSTGIPPPAGAPYTNSYDNSPLMDSQYPPPLLDDGGYSRGRTLSTGGGFGQPPFMSSGQPMTPYPSQYRPKRARRASSVGPGMGHGGYVPDMYHRPGGRVAIKFRLTGEHRSGITLNEALSSERLSQSRPYMLHDIAPDMYRKITLKVRWSGYRSNIYDIPLSTDPSGYVNLQSLARRTARAIVHFMQANGIFLSWERVVIHRLEEISPGIWIPVLITH